MKADSICEKIHQVKFWKANLDIYWRAAPAIRVRCHIKTKRRLDLINEFRQSLLCRTLRALLSNVLIPFSVIWEIILLQDNNFRGCHALCNALSTKGHYWKMNFKDSTFSCFLPFSTIIFVFVVCSCDCSWLYLVFFVVVIVIPLNCIFFIELRILPSFWTPVQYVAVMCPCSPAPNASDEDFWKQANVVSGFHGYENTLYFRQLFQMRQRLEMFCLMTSSSSKQSF